MYVNIGNDFIIIKYIFRTYGDTQKQGFTSGCKPLYFSRDHFSCSLADWSTWKGRKGSLELCECFIPN